MLITAPVTVFGLVYTFACIRHSKLTIRRLLPSLLEDGFFGLGELQQHGHAVCRYFKEDATISLSDSEVLIRDSLCLPKVVSRQGETGQSLSPIVGTSGIITGTPHIPGICPKLLNQLVLKFNVPRGKIPQIMGVINFLQSKFQSLAMEQWIAFRVWIYWQDKGSFATTRNWNRRSVTWELVLVSTFTFLDSICFADGQFDIRRVKRAESFWWCATKNTLMLKRISGDSSPSMRRRSLEICVRAHQEIDTKWKAYSFRDESPTPSSLNHRLGSLARLTTCTNNDRSADEEAQRMS